MGSSANPPAENKLRCAYCPWTCARFTTGADGKPRSGASKLYNHVTHAHFDQYVETCRKNGVPVEDGES